jgi:hypothetical protein
MIRFLLHGGRLKLEDSRNDSYFQALTRDLEDKDQVLFIGFARRNEADRNEVFEREKGLILAQTNKSIEIVNATYENLIEQVKSAKAIEITGGQSPELVTDLQKYPDFIASLSGKVVGGSSAGACLFSSYYWYGEENTVHEGLGLLPIRLVVHYGSSEYKATDGDFKQLASTANELELVKIEECAWIERKLYQ